MSRQLSLPLADAHPRLALGICLGNRLVGVAVATREELVRAQVLGIHHSPTRMRAGRLAKAIGRLLDVYVPSQVALVHVEGSSPGEILATFRSWLANEAVVRGVAVNDHAAHDVRAVTVPTGTRPTNRTLAHALAHRFPELAPRAPKEPELTQPNGPWIPRQTLRSSRERYFVRLFLAVAGALHDLEEDLKTRLLS